MVPDDELRRKVIPMKMLASKFSRLLLVPMTCAALSTAIIGCGDDDDAVSPDAGHVVAGKSGAAGSSVAGKGGNTAIAGKGGATAGTSGDNDGGTIETDAGTLPGCDAGGEDAGCL